MLDGLNGQLLILNQIIHLTCVGAWLGGLMLLVMILRQPAEHSIKAILQRFSGVGYALVAGLVITGLINVRVLTGQFWPTPLLSGFALILLIKVVLVAAMLGLALFNRLRINDCEQRLTALKTSVILEWLLGMGAVAAVSLLGTMPPMITAETPPVGASLLAKAVCQQHHVECYDAFASKLAPTGFIDIPDRQVIVQLLIDNPRNTCK